LKGAAGIKSPSEKTIKCEKPRISNGGLKDWPACNRQEGARPEFRGSERSSPYITGNTRKK